MQFISFYLSRILNQNVFSSEFQIIGKLKDLLATSDTRNPIIKGAALSTKDGLKYIKWEFFTIIKKNEQYHITCSKIEEFIPDNHIFLYKNICDKQIIDVNGRKVVRVNDIRLAKLSDNLIAVAVDIGTEGLLRRLGLAKPFKKLSIKVPAKLILWNDVQTVYSEHDSLKLSQSYNKLSTLHPSDLADIIEDFDTKTGMIIFSQLDNVKAAEVLEEMEEETQVKVLESLSTDKAADILEEMSTDEVADILEFLDEDKAEEILNNIEEETSDEVRELMEYDDDLVGSLMTTDFISFNSVHNVQHILNFMRESKPEEELLFNMFIINENNKLIGTVSLRDIVINDPSTTLKSIINKDFIYMKDSNLINDLVKIVTKYNLFSIPIVNDDMELIGNVIINDIIYELIKSRRKIV